MKILKLQDPNGCIYDEDGYMYQNGEGEEYAANPFGDPEDLYGDGGEECD